MKYQPNLELRIGQSCGDGCGGVEEVGLRTTVSNAYHTWTVGVSFLDMRTLRGDTCLLMVRDH